MNDIVLHHYAGSPFSEKVRLVFGMKGVRWRSVIVPVTLPKPDVVALTGGYRRTPFMQIGADIWCDSALMLRVVDRLHPEPPLYPQDVQGLCDIVAQWADASLFWTAVPYTMQPAGAAHIFAGAPPEYLKHFGADRAAMNPNLRRASLDDGAANLNIYLGRLEAMLADARPFLLGALPSIADFAAAQSIWFIRRAPPIAEQIASHRKVAAWYERVEAFGHGESEALSPAEAIDMANQATGHAPCNVEAGSTLPEGMRVGVTPADYAHDEVVGKLVGLTAEESVIERVDERAGTLHVHFPRVGFHIKALQEGNA